MAKVNEFVLPEREVKCKEYMELVAKQQALLVRIRETIGRVVDVICDEIKQAEASPADKNKENSAAEMVNMLARMGALLVKIIPLELQLACIDYLSPKDRITLIGEDEEERLRDMDECADRWIEQRRNHAEKKAAEAAAADNPAENKNITDGEPTENNF